MAKNKIEAFFYKTNYYLLPDDCKTYEEFSEKYKINDEIKTKQLVEEKCIAPYFVTEYAKNVKIKIEQKTYPAIVFLYSMKEYNEELRKIIPTHCDGCKNFGALSEDDESLNGHHEEISLDDVCYFRYYNEKYPEIRQFSYKDDIENFIEDFESRIDEFEKLILKNKNKKVEKIISEMFSEYFGLVTDTFFVGKNDDGFFMYFSSMMNYTISGAMLPIFRKLQKIQTKNKWTIKNYIPQGFFAKISKKPKAFVFKEVEFEKKYISITVKAQNQKQKDSQYFWFCGQNGENRLLYVLETFISENSIKTKSNLSEIESFVNENTKDISPENYNEVPPLIITPLEDINKELVITGYYSTAYQDFVYALQSNKYYNIWNDFGILKIYKFPLIKLTYYFEEGENALEIFEDGKPSKFIQEKLECLENIICHLKDNIIAQVVVNNLYNNRHEILFLVFDLVDFMRKMSYFAPILSKFKTTFEIFTDDYSKKEKYEVDYKLKIIE